MPRQSRSIPEIMTDRIATVAALSSQNAEHLRLLQIAGGGEIDRLRHSRDGTEPGDGDDIADTHAALARSQSRLAALEAELDRLDGELADANNPEDPS